MPGRAASMGPVASSRVVLLHDLYVRSAHHAVVVALHFIQKLPEEGTLLESAEIILFHQHVNLPPRIVKHVRIYFLLGY